MELTKKPRIINLSGNPLKIPYPLKGMEKLIILPDYSPGRGIVPTGSVAIFGREHVINPEFIGPDIGCGMMLTRFTDNLKSDLKKLAEEAHQELKKKKKSLGTLGGGNHFLNFYNITDSNSSDFTQENLFILIHTGSRLEGKRVFESGYKGSQYFEEHNKALEFSRRNRRELAHLIERLSKTKLEIILDSTHNQVSYENNQIVYRKGAVRVNSGDLTIIPSTCTGEAILVEALPKVSEIEFSMCHGTGRKISRSESKELDPSLCYRNINEIWPLIQPYVIKVATLKPLISIN